MSERNAVVVCNGFTLVTISFISKENTSGVDLWKTHVVRGLPWHCYVVAMAFAMF